MDGSSEYLDDGENTTVKQPFEVEPINNRFSRISQCASNHINYLTKKHITPADEDDGGNDRRLILLGMTGSGKSCLGNYILGEETFESRPSSKSVTRKSKKGVKNRFGKNLTVIDTPSLNNTELAESEFGFEIGNCVMLSSPGPTCFILTIPIGRDAHEFATNISFIKLIFGEEMFGRTIVVFTRGQELRNHEIPIDDYINQDPDLSAIVQRCASYMSFDTEVNVLSQITQLMDKVDEIHLKYNESYYDRGHCRVPAQATELKLKRKYQRESAKFRSMVRPLVEPVFQRMLQIEKQNEDLKNENVQLKKELEKQRKSPEQSAVDINKCLEEVMLLRQSLDKTNNEVTNIRHRQTNAISTLTNTANELRNEMRSLGGVRRVLPPRESSRPQPYVSYMR